MKEELDALHNSKRHHLIIIKKMSKGDISLKGSTKKERANNLFTIIRQKIATLPQVNVSAPTILSMYLLPLPNTDTTIQDFRLTCATQKDAIEIRNRILNARQAKIRSVD